MDKIKTKKDLDSVLECIRQRREGTNEGFMKFPEETRKLVYDVNLRITPNMIEAQAIKESLSDLVLSIRPDYLFDIHSSLVILEISQLLSDTTGKIGILIMGKVGCGKTTIMKAVKMFYDLLMPHGTKQPYIPSYNVSGSFSIDGFKIFEDGIVQNSNTNKIKVLSENLFIDDIGSEDLCNHFGTKTNSVGELFLRRYDLVLKTFATTNLDAKNLKIFYGERVYSRMVEMMKFVVMTGNDRRK